MESFKFYRRKAAKKRKEKNLTLIQLENQIGYSKSTISNWERGIIHPNITQVKAYAEAINEPVNTISNVKKGSITLPNVHTLLKEISNQFNFIETIDTKKLHNEQVELATKIIQLSNNFNQASVILSSLLSSNLLWYFKNTDNKYLICSNKYKQYLNFNFNITQKTDYDIFSKKIDADQNYYKDKEVLKSTKPIINERDYIIGTNKKYIGKYTRIPTYNSEGEIVGLLVSIEDVTQSTKDDKILSIFRNVFKQSNLGIVIEQVYPNHVYLYNNNEAVKNWGGELDSNGNVIDMTRYQWGWLKSVHPEDIDLKISMGKYMEAKFPYRYKIIVNNKVKWLEMMVFTSRMNDGSIVRIAMHWNADNIMRTKEGNIQYKAMNKYLQKYIKNYKLNDISNDIKIADTPLLEEELDRLKIKPKIF